jgi:UDP-glucose 4-epimerase
MKILVTGGAGYIGSHVVELLLQKNHQVVVFDNLVAGYEAAIPNAATFIKGDILNKDDLETCFSQQSFDGIMHFASHIAVGESMEKPFKFLYDNTVGVMNVLESATRHEVKRFIFSSTAALFGAPETMPISEAERIVPGSVYGETKHFAERMLLWMDEIYGLKYCALRYFNACGAHPNGHIGEAHQPETHLIPLVLQVALGQREHISIYGDDYNTPDGTCVRDYIHVMDLAEAHILALESLNGGKSRVYNLGNGSGYSVKEVIETCRKVTGHPIPAVTTPRRPGDLDTLVADSARIKQELGWQPQYADLEQIVETAWNWHKAHPNGFSD